MSVKQKCVVLSLEKKVLIINRVVDHGESVQKLANEFGVGQQTVRDLIKQKNEIFKFISCAEVSAKKRKTMKKSSLSDMESALFEWFKQKRIEGIPISGPMVCEKAKWFHEHLKIEETFNASQGWLFRFKTRHGIRQLDIQGESLSGDLTAATLFNDEFNSFLSKLNLSPDQVYNADELGLFWKMSDSDIAVRYGSVTTPSTSQQPDSSSESDNEEHFEKIQTSQAMEAVDVLLNFCEQENFDFHDVIGLRKIRSEVRKIISNQKKQRLITSYFKP